MRGSLTDGSFSPGSSKERMVRAAQSSNSLSIYNTESLCLFQLCNSETIEIKSFLPVHNNTVIIQAEILKIWGFEFLSSFFLISNPSEVLNSIWENVRIEKFLTDHNVSVAA